ncbi:unnamed protein product [Lactuca virosa]|uniref:Uncharacterized protein n=1 Tax=Lactuca virosa TaxID=75947 RepID=A0AAU9NVQ5_9ASTR|nr:unnamed protein product [Lactuca virosa]
MGAKESMTSEKTKSSMVADAGNLHVVFLPFLLQATSSLWSTPPGSLPLEAFAPPSSPPFTMLSYSNPSSIVTSSPDSPKSFRPSTFQHQRSDCPSE